MNVKDLLLNSQHFAALLKEFFIDVKDVMIAHEDLLQQEMEQFHQLIGKKPVYLEGKNEAGTFSFFGMLHFNLTDQRAVFELQEVQKKS